jgi:hypothetical protein
MFQSMIDQRYDRVPARQLKKIIPINIFNSDFTDQRRRFRARAIEQKFAGTTH